MEFNGTGIAGLCQALALAQLAMNKREPFYFFNTNTEKQDTQHSRNSSSPSLFSFPQLLKFSRVSLPRQRPLSTKLCRPTLVLDGQCPGF